MTAARQRAPPKASPPLLLACASGTHLKSAVLTGRKSGKAQPEFLTSRSRTCSSAPTRGGATADAPPDSISLAFGQIQVIYREQAADGSIGSPIRAGWDRKANK